MLSTATGVEVTPDSLFQIGSITKVWTATLVMQLVDEGGLDLDAPVVEALPGFRVADPDVTRTVTMRHLLTHTSGIDGDVFTDTGRGDDCVERYVAGLEGRRAEPSARRDVVLLQRRLRPRRPHRRAPDGSDVGRGAPRAPDRAARADATVTLPEEALLHRTAVGHVGEPGDDPVPDANVGARRAPWGLRA